jgi:glycosyltransferase involved in cell wall biosynthesis
MPAQAGSCGTMRKILYIVHNHPIIRPGGAEAYALELYHAMRASNDFDPALVARTGPGGSLEPSLHAGAPFSAIGDDPNQYFVYTETDGYDFFLQTYRDKALYTTYFADFLRSFDPDVVHFQHTQFIGYDLVTFIRRKLPEVPLVYTLHEFLPICHRDGQLVRTVREELCAEASPRRCNECFPEWTPQYFFLRERLIKSHLSHVDLFLAPSNFLLERYVDWGIPREKLRFEDYGRVPQRPLEVAPESRPHTRLGFFGQLSPYKGVDVLLDAMEILHKEAPGVHLFLHGANLDVLREKERESMVAALDRSGANVTFTGSYDAVDVPRLMSEIDWVVVPSRWWENSPLVIQEAFMHDRPVICSDVGGMAEKVTNGVNGLHFGVGSAIDLAEKIRIAVSTPGLWDRLRDGIPHIYEMDEHVSSLTRTYDDLIERRAVPNPEAPAVAQRAG